MGKANFEEIYRRAYEALGRTPTIKLSHFCDNYHPSKNFAGLIIYHHDASYEWEQTDGLARGYKGRAFYVIILCTENWPDHAMRRAGEGKVHDYMYHQIFGEKNDFRRGRTCCGGFAILQGDTKYSSIWLNLQSNPRPPQPPGGPPPFPQVSHPKKFRWRSDGSKFLSEPERQIVDLAVARWKAKTRHDNGVITIPRLLHEQLMPPPPSNNGPSLTRILCCAVVRQPDDDDR